MANVHEEIRQFIFDNFLLQKADTHFADSASLIEAGIMDSAGILELVGFVEEKYRIAVDDQDLMPANFDSVDSLAAFVMRKLDRPKKALA